MAHIMDQNVNKANIQVHHSAKSTRGPQHAVEQIDAWSLKNILNLDHQSML